MKNTYQVHRSTPVEAWANSEIADTTYIVFILCNSTTTTR